MENMCAKTGVQSVVMGWRGRLIKQVKMRGYLMILSECIKRPHNPIFCGFLGVFGFMYPIYCGYYLFSLRCKIPIFRCNEKFGQFDAEIFLGHYSVNLDGKAEPSERK